MADPTALMTVAEVAATLRCSVRRVFELLEDGTLVRGPRFGKKTVIVAESVFRACEAAYHPPPSPAPKRQRRAQPKRDFNASIDALAKRVRS